MNKHTRDPRHLKLPAAEILSDETELQLDPKTSAQKGD